MMNKDLVSAAIQMLVAMPEEFREKVARMILEEAARLAAEEPRYSVVSSCGQGSGVYINAIKIVRHLTNSMLKDAKRMVDGAIPIRSGMTQAEAAELLLTLSNQGYPLQVMTIPDEEKGG